MANRIDSLFVRLREAERKALVTYIVAGDRSLEATVPAMHQLVRSGADIIELGVPFSDPSAEGPVIQRGHERALANGASLRKILGMVAEFRRDDSETPVVLMGYVNPIERMGYEAFADAAREAGVDGMLTVDLPAEESASFARQLSEREMRNIFLLTPTTDDVRAKSIVDAASGFVYYVSLKGVTGAGHLDLESVSTNLNRFREMTELPICVGFGIKDGASARAVSEGGDGAVVGSLLVDAMGAAETDQAALEKIGALVAEIRQALDG